ncbi:protein DA1-related 1 [Citrus sinensis]|nr:protein DA1-related 1 [Citrus sinensis]
MGWLTKILKGSSRRHYHARYGDDRTWDERRYSAADDSSGFDNEEIDRAIALSLVEVDQKGKKVIEDDLQCIKSDDSDEDELDEDEIRAIAQQEEDERRAKAQQEEDEQRAGARAQLEEDEQLAKAIQDSLRVDSPPRYDSGNIFQPFPFFSGYRICAGCNTEIGHGRYLSCMEAFWHPECFRCHSCNLPITDVEIPTNSAGLIEYRAHPFWLQKYCPSHERDGTPRCCSCERMEPRDTKYLSLDDGRKLCLECLDSAIMDTHECQPLYLEIQEFYEGLNMKVEQQVPLLLVERQALNEAMEGEKNVLRRPRIGAGYRLIDMITEPYRLIRRCEVTAILILYGLPRLLTGSILAHEMMHAWLRLKGSDVASSSSSSASSSSSSPSSSSTSSKKGKRSDFEKDLGKFFKHQIESDTSSAYGDGFREGSKAVNKYGLRRTLDHIQMTGSFPY